MINMTNEINEEDTKNQDIFIVEDTQEFEEEEW